MITEIRQIGENGYTITHKLISKKDKVLLAVHEVSWDNDLIKLTETVFEFGSSPAKKHYKEQEMKTHFIKMKSKPQSVAGSYATEELDDKRVAILKEERASWWEGGLKKHNRSACSKRSSGRNSRRKAGRPTAVPSLHSLSATTPA